MAEKKSINKNNRFSLLDDDSDDDTSTKVNTRVEKVNKSDKPETTSKNTNFVTNNKTTINSSVFTKTNDTLNKAEESLFQQFYGKNETKINKSTKYQNKNGNNSGNSNKSTKSDDNGFVMVTSKKKEKVVIECVYKEIEENIPELKMPNYYRILAHHNDDKNWDLLSHHNITTLIKWNELSKFFNCYKTTTGECCYTDFDTFIMKNDITPLWEDQDNRNGCICSVKVSDLDDAYDIWKMLTVHMANNTLLKFSTSNWDIINGLSFSPRKMDHLNPDSYCIIIKIWFKNNIYGQGLDIFGYNSEYKIVEKYFNEEINNTIKKYSIKFKAIKPEY